MNKEEQITPPQSPLRKSAQEITPVRPTRDLNFAPVPRQHGSHFFASKEAEEQVVKAKRIDFIRYWNDRLRAQGINKKHFYTDMGSKLCIT